MPLHTTVLLSGWAAVFDTTNQAFYYHNLATDETTWVLPASATAAPAVEKAEPVVSKSSPEIDDPAVQQADKRSKADKKSSSGLGSDGGSGGTKAKSSKMSKRRKSPGEETSSERVDTSDAASAGKTTSRKGGESSTRVDQGPEKAGEEPPKDAKPAAAAQKESESASTTESLPRYGQFCCWRAGEELPVPGDAGPWMWVKAHGHHATVLLS